MERNDFSSDRPTQPAGQNAGPGNAAGFEAADNASGAQGFAAGSSTPGSMGRDSQSDGSTVSDRARTIAGSARTGSPTWAPRRATGPGISRTRWPTRWSLAPTNCASGPAARAGRSPERRTRERRPRERRPCHRGDEDSRDGHAVQRRVVARRGPRWTEARNREAGQGASRTHAADRGRLGVSDRQGLPEVARRPWRSTDPTAPAVSVACSAISRRAAPRSCAARSRSRSWRSAGWSAGSARGRRSVAMGAVFLVLGTLSVMTGVVLLIGDQWLPADLYWLAALIML